MIWVTPRCPREMTSFITGVPAIRSRIRLPCGSGGAARYDPDGRKGTNRLAALIVGGPFDLRDPLRSGPRRRQFDHFALDVEHIAVSHRHHPAQFVDAARRCDRAPAHSMRAKNRRVCAGDFPSCSNASNSLSGTTGCSSGEGSRRRKRTWAVETSVHCRNNPRQTMISLSTDISGPVLDQL